MIDKDGGSNYTKEKVIAKLIFETIVSVFVFIVFCVYGKLLVQTETWLCDSIVISIFCFVGRMTMYVLGFSTESKEVGLGTLILDAIVMCVFLFFIFSFITGVILELKEWNRIPIMCVISFFLSSLEEITTINKKSNL